MNILGIGCHPDELEVFCGGTLAKYSESEVRTSESMSRIIDMTCESIYVSEA